MEQLNLTTDWDKVFPRSDKVDHSKVTFHNRYGITLAADLYIPKGAIGRLPAIAVCGPFGAVKEQSSGLYAQTMAEQAEMMSNSIIAYDKFPPKKRILTDELLKDFQLVDYTLIAGAMEFDAAAGLAK